MDALIQISDVTKRYDDDGVAAVDGVSLRIGMIFQFFNLIDDLTVLDNVMLPAQLIGTPRRRALARAGELLAALKIEQHRQAYPARLQVRPWPPRSSPYQPRPSCTP